MTLRFITGFLLVCLCSGCTKLWVTETETGPYDTPVNQQAFQSSQEPVRQSHRFTNPQTSPTGVTPDVEVVWASPGTAVDSYTIKYGFTRDELAESVTVPVDALEKYEDPTLGFVYRYQLRGIPESRSVFISLVAHSNGESSPPSQTIEIPAK